VASVMSLMTGRAVDWVTALKGRGLTTTTGPAY